MHKNFHCISEMKSHWISQKAGNFKTLSTEFKKWNGGNLKLLLLCLNWKFTFCASSWENSLLHSGIKHMPLIWGNPWNLYSFKRVWWLHCNAQCDTHIQKPTKIHSDVICLLFLSPFVHIKQMKNGKAPCWHFNRSGFICSF